MIIKNKIIKSTYKNRLFRYDEPPTSLGTMYDWKKLTKK